jgi:hypothetical protein
MDIELVILVVGAIGVAIAFYAIREDRQDKEIKRLVDRAIDKDNDGWILEGTLLERKAPKKKKAVAKKKPVKKAVAKKKSSTTKKVVKKKSAPVKKAKKKVVAKKKSR